MGKSFTAFSLILLTLTSLFTFPKTAFSAGSNSAIKSVDLSNKIEVKEDKRAKILQYFLNKYNSPLAEYSEVFVREADKNNLDWRFVAAISGVESTFGREIPYNSYNAWGWGIFGDQTYSFPSWEEAITTISRELRQKYIDKWGAKDVHQIGKFYAASPTWSQRVVYFMGKIEEFDQKNPKNRLSLSL